MPRSTAIAVRSTVMGLFGFSLGTPTIEQFADLFVKELRRTGDRGEFSFDPEHNSLNNSNGKSLNQINLANMFKDYCRLPRGERKAWLRKTCQWLNRSSHALPGFAQAKAQLMPALRSRFVDEIMRLRFEAEGKEWHRPTRVISDYLLATVVLDEDRGLRSITQDEFDQWGISFDEAMDVAIANLDRTSPAHIARLEPLVYLCQTKDAYDATRMLSARFEEWFPVDGLCLAMPVARDTLLVTSADNESGLQGMACLATEFADEPHPIVPIPHALVGGQWRPWQLPERHPARPKFDELALKHRGGEYAEQTPLLQAWLDAKGIEAVAAEFTASQNPATGAVRTYAVLTQGCPTWLPKTDDIVFFDPQTDLAKKVSWEDAATALGDSLVREETWPPRWSVEEFPDDDTLQNMPGQRSALNLSFGAD